MPKYLLVLFRVIGALALAVALVLGVGSSIQENDSSVARILQASGYRDVHLTGYRMFSCSDDDFFRVGFTAVSPTGQPISGAVCRGVFKGHTIRLD